MSVIGHGGAGDAPAHALIARAGVRARRRSLLRLAAAARRRSGAPRRRAVRAAAPLARTGAPRAAPTTAARALPPRHDGRRALPRSARATYARGDDGGRAGASGLAPRIYRHLRAVRASLAVSTPARISAHRAVRALSS